jgi:hypothetical protein
MSVGIDAAAVAHGHAGCTRGAARALDAQRARDVRPTAMARARVRVDALFPDASERRAADTCASDAVFVVLAVHFRFAAVLGVADAQIDRCSVARSSVEELHPLLATGGEREPYESEQCSARAQRGSRSAARACGESG